MTKTGTRTEKIGVRSSAASIVSGSTKTTTPHLYSYLNNVNVIIGLRCISGFIFEAFIAFSSPRGVIALNVFEWDKFLAQSENLLRYSHRTFDFSIIELRIHLILKSTEPAVEIRDKNGWCGVFVNEFNERQIRCLRFLFPFRLKFSVVDKRLYKIIII